MTTIAFRDGVVAADTGLTIGGSQHAHSTKIARNKKGDVIGCSGCIGTAAAFHRWFAAGEKGKPPEVKINSSGDDVGRAVIFRASGEIEVFESSGKHTVRAPYYAIGSGRCEALGAMFVGATAPQAVGTAIALDSSTFGEIDVLKVGKAEGR